MNLIRILKALGDGTRLSIVNLLRVETLCVCEIEAIIQSSQSNVSRHLGKLRDAGIIYSEKKSQWVYYGINMELVNQYSFIKTLLKEDLAKHPEYQEELAKLKIYREQNSGCQNAEDIGV
ncbi:MAG: metalloregulator ArsR/SmtB family transcription factor [Sporomusaceae bacterium]|nr:metalloregulator ArsR/SmtB family transcription factor [Sporomusaceae bacterium]